jgi:hypothetical protein
MSSLGTLVHAKILEKQAEHLAAVYQYFTPEQWSAIIRGIRNDKQLNDEQRDRLLSRCPSAFL